MATTNPVFQVLVPTGNQALLAAGNRPEDLAIGQMGIFNYHTGLSIDGSVGADAKDIFFAVGVDPDSTGQLQDIMKSAGQMIQVRNAKSLTFRGTVDSLPKIVDIAGFAAKCEKEYAIKIELRNGQIYAENGYNQFTKTFTYKTGCCADPCEDCGDGDNNELAEGLVAEVNKDVDGLVKADLFANLITATINVEPTADGNTTVTIGSTEYVVAVLNADTAAEVAAKIVAAVNGTTNTPYKGRVTTGATMVFAPVATVNGDTSTFAVSGSGVGANAITAATKTVVSDATTFKTNYPGVSMGIRLTAQDIAKSKYRGNINLQYVKNRETDMIVALLEGFTCNGNAVTAQESRKSEGLGYDIRQLEYEAGGFNGMPGPYRLSNITGMERGNFFYQASVSGKYNVFVLTYDQMSVGGWLKYLNNLMTMVAVPCADSTTMASIATVFDLIFTQFGGMAGDVAANGDCTNAATSTLAPATDGIESLA